MITPKRDLVLVKPEESEKITKGGIIIPDPTAEKPQRGTVKSIGELVKDTKVGDEVLFKQYGNYQHYKDEGVEYLLMKETEITATL